MPLIYLYLYWLSLSVKCKGPTLKRFPPERCAFDASGISGRYYRTRLTLNWIFQVVVSSTEKKMQIQSQTHMDLRIHSKGHGTSLVFSLYWVGFLLIHYMYPFLSPCFVWSDLRSGALFCRCTSFTNLPLAHWCSNPNGSLDASWVCKSCSAGLSPQTLVPVFSELRLLYSRFIHWFTKVL